MPLRVTDRARLGVLALVLGGGGHWESARSFEAPKIEARAGTPVKVEGTQFIQDGHEVVIVGLNYFPAYFPAIFPGPWLDSRHYLPEIVEGDLAAIERLGFNLVSIQGLKSEVPPSEEDCANLRDFLERARRHRLLVNLYIGTGGLVPIERPARLAVVPGGCRLAGHGAIFAYDIAWEPHFGSAARRSSLYDRWLKWIRESYGSVGEAERAFGGTYQLPTDEELCGEAPSVKIAAFRRFLDDALNVNYREVRAAITKVDATHLIGVRSGYGGNGSRSACGLALVDLRAGAKHLDFVSPEGYALPVADKSGLLARGAFTSAYGDVGKPIFWSEFGVNAGGGCENCSEESQARFVRDMWEMVRTTRTNGGAVWWFAGVRPQNRGDGEKSDYGIVYDYVKFPTVIDDRRMPSRAGSVALCVADPKLEGLYTMRPLGSDGASRCPSGTFARGQFRSEIAAGAGSGSPIGIGARPGKWETLCGGDEDEMLVVTADDKSGETFACPEGYDGVGAFKPADAEREGEAVAVDSRGRSISSGWVSLCSRDHQAILRLVYDKMSGRTAECPPELKSAGTFQPKAVPIFRPAALQVRSALSGATAVDRKYSTWITVDRDSAAGDWKMYEVGTRSLALAAATGHSVGVRSSCFKATSREERFCVGNMPNTGACPAKCLNAELSLVEILNSDGYWEPVQDGGEVTVSAENRIRARLVAGNIGESKWLSGKSVGEAKGAVRFGCNENAGDLGCRADIARDVDSGLDIDSGKIEISDRIEKKMRITFQMVSENVAWFGERVNVMLVPK